MKLLLLAALTKLILGVMVTVTVSTLQLPGLAASQISYLSGCVPDGLFASTVTSPVAVFNWM